MVVLGVDLLLLVRVLEELLDAPDVFERELLLVVFFFLLPVWQWCGFLPAWQPFLSMPPECAKAGAPAINAKVAVAAKSVFACLII